MKAPELDFLFSIGIETHPMQDIGSTPLGHRRVVQSPAEASRGRG